MNMVKRKELRLKDYDYSSGGAYFITICTRDRKEILGSIKLKDDSVGGGRPDAPNAEVVLSEYGKAVQYQIEQMGQFSNRYVIEKYVVMPNHFHLIICISEGKNLPSHANSEIAKFVSELKRGCNRKAGISLFQRSYYDHIIRNEQDYAEIWRYIDQNPKRWALDKMNPNQRFGQGW